MINFKNTKYTWSSRDIQPMHTDWHNPQRPDQYSDKNPIDYFDCMFDDVVLNILVEFTNLYATKNNKEGNVTARKMKCFLGILLYSGYVVVPRQSMYWENASDCSVPFVSSAMASDRFNFIVSHLHFCNNSQLNERDKFAKLKPLFDVLNSNFFKHAPLHECHSIDEAMVPYYGGHPCKQFIICKSIRWGYMFWVGATCLGYFLWFQPYQEQGCTDTKYKSLELGVSVVLQYADELRKINAEVPFHLFFDNFFTSIPLIDELRTRGLKATRTVRENRVYQNAHCPLTLKSKKKITVGRTNTNLQELKKLSSVSGMIIV
ncbi:unnamed protein product [Parnassius apollo]|uniref:(apollo) hypothetical protein n=1 Tax=Parnassius apollo TaxID=110799 RepID=A0A8S3X0D3_PARAO|nr:unnamed protein product [Parnassius apollo]